MRMLQTGKPQIFLAIALFAALLGCASKNQPVAIDAQTPAENLSTKTVRPVGFKKFMGIFTPYRVTVQQGNFVSKEMADQVKVGMTREQVRFLLGTALLTDMFHADRWDYVFRLLKPNGELITSRVTVYFEQSLVSNIERGDLPSEQEYLTQIIDANH